MAEDGALGVTVVGVGIFGNGLVHQHPVSVVFNHVALVDPARNLTPDINNIIIVVIIIVVVVVITISYSKFLGLNRIVQGLCNLCTPGYSYW